MEFIKYIILSIVQGIAEVLPISSSGHLVITKAILGMGDEGITFSVFLHLASLIATVIFLRKRLWYLIKGFFVFIFNKNKREETRYQFIFCWLIVLATIPAVIAALLFKDTMEKMSSTVWLVGLFLMINGTAIFLFPKLKITRKDDELNYKDALVIGGFQVFGLLSGISRSGSCISGACVRGIDRERAADFAFILLVPAALGATVLEFNDFGTLLKDTDNLYLYISSFIITGIITFFSFKVLLAIIRRQKLSYFGIYCFGVGLLTLVLGVIYR